METQINRSNNPDELKAEKKLIRNEIKIQKAQISNSEKELQARVVFGKIEQLPEFNLAKTIFIYWSLPDELPTHFFIEKWCKQKIIILPAVVGENMELKVYNSKSEMKTGELNISEPNTSEIFSGNIDLIIVPGIAFDKNKNRLGRGKGFYDRFFKTENVIKIGVGFNFQLKDSIPVDKFDVSMNKIITSEVTIN